jgi:hypothetical protein
LLKKLKLGANEAATDKLAINELITKFITLEFTNNLAIIKLNIIKPLKTSREATS